MPNDIMIDVHETLEISLLHLHLISVEIEYIFLNQHIKQMSRKCGRNEGNRFGVSPCCAFLTCLLIFLSFQCIITVSRHLHNYLNRIKARNFITGVLYWLPLNNMYQLSQISCFYYKHVC